MNPSAQRPWPDCPLVVAYGLGVNSTAMLVEFARRGIRPDLILFADTGGEKPETYQYLDVIRPFLARVGDANYNPFSGKWNFHFGRVTAEEAFRDFATALNRVLEPVSSPATSTPVEPGPDANGSRYPLSLESNEGGLFVSESSGIAVRRFEFSGGNSNKFWEVSVRDKDVLVRFGRIGAAGQAQVKSFADEQAAAKHVEKLIREKTGKGYREVV
jgi:predicted DNA-binding WGR domain protein